MNSHIRLVVLIASMIGNLLSSNLTTGHIRVAFSAEPQVRVIIPHGLPINFDSAIVERKRDSALLKYRVTNESNEHIKGGRATLTFHRGSTEGHTWYQLGSEWDIAPHSNLDEVTEIEKEIAQDELLLIVVLEVESEKSLWKVDALKLNGAVKNYLQGKPYTLPDAQWWEVVKKKVLSNNRFNESRESKFVMFHQLPSRRG